MDPVIFVQLALSPIDILPEFEKHTSILTSAHRFRTHVVLGFCDPSISKSPEVSGVFNAVAPLDGKWTLEVAIELSDLLPSLDGKSEAIVATRDASGKIWLLLLSNRMSRFHYQDGDTAYHILAPRQLPWHGEVQAGASDGGVAPAAEEQLRTVVAMRFEIEGDTTENAFESSIKPCLRILYESASAALIATRDAELGLAPTMRTVNEDNVSSAYVLVSGEGRPQGSRLLLGMSRMLLYPPMLKESQSARFRAVADGSVVLDDVSLLLGAARSSWQDGNYEFAFLQGVIAAEISTTRAIRAACIRNGVSKKRLDDNRKEMTYSWALNIGLPLCFPPSSRPRNDLILAMNAARVRRNDLMHEAAFEMTRAELRKLLDDTDEYVKALKAAGTLSPASSTSDNSAKGDEEQQRKAAYFSWLCRGKPEGDDWSDWFAKQ